MKASRWLLLIPLAAALYITAADFASLRGHDFQSDPPPESAFPAWQPWGGYTARKAARAGGAMWLTDPEHGEALMLQAARVYPLYVRQWFGLGRIEVRRGGDSVRLEALLDAAVAVQPNHRSNLWRASQMAIQAGNNEQAEALLRGWQGSSRVDTERALSIIGRWRHDPDQWLAAALPDFSDERLEAAMRYARRIGHTGLAEAVLERLPGELALDHPVFVQYADFLREQGRLARLAELWARVDPTYEPGGIANADFSRAFGADSGLNWRTARMPAGARVDRDETTFVTAPASLQVRFDGKHNLRLNRPEVAMIAEPGWRYRLSGQWKADGVTTRSRAFLWLAGEGVRERLDMNTGDFDWQTWEFEFDLAHGASGLLRLRLRRNTTDAFDRYIDGTLWLDALRLEPIAPLALPEPEHRDDANA